MLFARLRGYLKTSKKKEKGCYVPDLRTVVQEVMDKHPKDCIFTPNAVENIVASVMAERLSDPRYWYSPSWVLSLERAFRAEEIYCPHEGIDRRAEFGMELGNEEKSLHV